MSTWLLALSNLAPGEPFDMVGNATTPFGKRKGAIWAFFGINCIEEWWYLKLKIQFSTSFLQPHTQDTLAQSNSSNNKPMGPLVVTHGSKGIVKPKVDPLNAEGPVIPPKESITMLKNWSLSMKQSWAHRKAEANSFPEGSKHPDSLTALDGVTSRVTGTVKEKQGSTSFKGL
ncbi:uncharacterized protein EI90DRAFT_3021655 [Cantharellus anzutake]|uniref:uncharacterized protein n=1 Tax=Cantharellus anzutake TaxID=1750568 RepID=UPI0019056FC6|nr:uncharacterized protein EI90DRAFT_3021655 [Cantharellus anzutake]KAF8316236.1 hypothetical protein EI90DRAFT_3021655 [Cantharellus anzutake]